jgi:hypothetical protein
MDKTLWCASIIASTQLIAFLSITIAGDPFIYLSFLSCQCRSCEIHFELMKELTLFILLILQDIYRFNNKYGEGKLQDDSFFIEDQKEFYRRGTDFLQV